MCSGVRGGIDAGGNVDLDLGDVGTGDSGFMATSSNQLDMAVARGKNDGGDEAPLDG